ncbi:hypothetical protein B1H10_02565 [candidate division KSB1 bacterium 4484_188]|nr:MAG: hypothetical protein B1H10_02565 [candidate division KSB1 bacterium 4484_188]
MLCRRIFLLLKLLLPDCCKFPETSTSKGEFLTGGFQVVVKVHLRGRDFSLNVFFDEEGNSLSRISPRSVIPAEKCHP